MSNIVELAINKQSRYKYKLSELLNSIEDIQDDISIHCDTYNKAKRLLAALDKLGYTWITRTSLIKYDNYTIYGDRTCYDIHHNKFITYKGLGIDYKEEVSYKYDDIDIER